MNPDHLIEPADQILHIGTGRLEQATVNRAVSTADYALFHAPAGECVARTVGSPRPPRYWEIVTSVHRSIDHGATREVFERLARDRTMGADVELLAGNFLDSQSARDAADYEPACRCSRQEASDSIRQARLAIGALRSMPKEDRLVLAIRLITKPR